MSLPIKLEIYEGPLDLLLHLIKKNEVDIYDIPIALITTQYLEYLDLMESLNVEVAGEFLIMAATLTQIKSNMLLPVSEDEETAEEEDPRMAIIRPLIEHMKMKDAAQSLARREILNRDVFSRTPAEEGFEGQEDQGLITASLFDLMDSFRKLLTVVEQRSGLEFVIDTKTFEERIGEMIDQLKEYHELAFEKIFEKDRSRAELILTFLGILELARIGLLRIFQHPQKKQLMIFYVEPQSLTLVENESESEENEDEPSPTEILKDDLNGKDYLV